MEQTFASKNYGGNAPENYRKFFVPSIGGPIAVDLIARANLQPGEQVLDVACGTGVVAGLAARAVGADGRVTGLDLNPGMLAVARESQDAERIDWVESDAETMPFSDQTFEVVLCQMGLQFIQNKLSALREMRRVLAPGGRIVVNVPGPKPQIFTAMNDGVRRHFGKEAGMFLDLVFSLHDPDDLTDLFSGAGFTDVDAQARAKSLLVPPPAEFLWQYIHSTPLAQAAENADQHIRDKLQTEVCAKLSDLIEGGRTRFEVPITTIHARR